MVPQRVPNHLIQRTLTTIGCSRWARTAAGSGRACSMHEMSLAHNILEIVQKTAAHHQVSKVTKVTIRAGQLRGIIPEQLRFCFEFVAKDSVAEGAELVVHTLPVKARCKKCEGSFFVREYQFLCPDCGSEELELVQGMELLVENIEVSDG
jgi:hydrogenase nickel incorporation protein HypA/HybF